MPIIILFKEKPTPNDESFVTSNQGEIKQKFHIINGFAASIPEDKLEKIKSHSTVLSVDPDVEVHAIGLSSDKQIRADQVWIKGDSGAQVPVAILDTGIDARHSEFSGRVIKCHSEIATESTCSDFNGHGTHVAGIVGAAGLNSNAKGVAPAVYLYIDKVLDGSGAGSLSTIIAGIDWVRTSTNAKIISMSLGTDPVTKYQPNCDTAFPTLTSAVNNAVAAGISVVAAAGNEGGRGVGAPGCISSSIVVGAVDSTNLIPSWSSGGAPLADHGLVAPGVGIYSTYLAGGYAIASGTSMATPHVSGAIALLLKANPGLTPAQIKSRLFGTACIQTTTPSCPTGKVPNDTYGHGRIDALAAYNAVLLAGAPLSTTLYVSPTTGTVPLTITIAVTTTGGTGPYGYSVYVQNPDGSYGCFSYSPSSTCTLKTAGTYSVFAFAWDHSNPQQISMKIVKVTMTSTAHTASLLTSTSKT